MVRNNWLKTDKVEKWIFLLMTGINLVPVLIFKFFPTMDGAAHLYNSNLINCLLFESNPLLNSFFDFNPVPVPNWTGHLFLSVFNYFLPAFIAEKALLIFYFVGLPYAFRGLINTINPENRLLSYLIFPFTYSFLLLLGFYNFSIAIVLMLITLQCWIRESDRWPISIRKIILLSILMVFTYFSHVVVFAILLLLIGIDLFFKEILLARQKSNGLNPFFKKTGILIGVSFIPIVLLLFFIIRPSVGSPTFLERYELIAWLKKIRPIIAYNIEVEEVYTTKIFYVITGLLVIVGYTRINQVIQTVVSSPKSKFFSILKQNIFSSESWIVAALLVLALYFILPDSNGSAGFVSIRFGLLFFIILLIWITSQTIPKWLVITAVVVVLFVHLKRERFYLSVIKDLNTIAVDCYSASKQIAPNSIVLPVNYSNNWLVGHFSNYLGIDKPMIILENYECGSGLFPLKWKESFIPNTMLGNLTANQLPCLQWKSNIENSMAKIDYVFVLGNLDMKTDSCSTVLKDAIFENYELICSNNNYQLFKENNRATQ
ncbi:MAG: hypothetical protein A2W90_13215 [Bacteroidetes bacterium GWF2_42_66]|nr:MAG: hypothetical protein A2W92_19275 [Bacteroidetes bacterium GWA2_42_15]OFY00177.1 MAG: hypothetical protein A2W89_18205 [Bacteroidetes bacterium GWE2_42_39]OFY40318.1 MAG: hypothetical protein A2W90_13215 [Bacteroidetes bacterium GWF2_42_66]HBL73696.1 hypothetical protein [Prolixibacteraceae bacterium]HCR90706.1 hypothetical protein [Prolixibacteraceae bacterium]